MGGYMTAAEVLHGIYVHCADQAQKDRLTDAFDQYPSFLAALETKNYEIPRAKILQALNEAIVIQADYDLVSLHIDYAERIKRIPEGE